MAKTCNVEDCDNPRWGKGYCKHHQYLRTDKKPKPLKQTRIKKEYKPTGELALFKEIWAERPHFCFVSGKKLPHFDVRLFAHVIPKGNSPNMRLDKNNIVLLTPSNHYLYDHCVHQAKKLPMFDKLFELRQELRTLDSERNKIPNFDK